MKFLFLIFLVLVSLKLRAEELVVRVANLPAKSVLIGKNRNIISSVNYKITENQIVFTGKAADIDFLRQMVAQKTLMPFFADAYQELSPVNYTISYQVRDPLYLISLSQGLSCRSSSLRHSVCGDLKYFTSPFCKMTSDLKKEIENALKVTASLEDAKLLKVVTDNPCINPKIESLYEFALKTIVHQIGLGDFEEKMDYDFAAYIVTEHALEII